MHRYLSAVAAVLLFACLPMTARCDKVTQDPNAPGAAKPAVANQEADPRLARKVTYYGGYKRLSALADELTKETGVGIRCGSSPMDWQVRDIPMVVAVKDVPLGKLLDAIAACAHAKLVAERIGPDQHQAPSYRFTRTKAQRDDLDQRASVITEANRKLASWAWDALVAYAGKPEAELTIKNKYPFMRVDSRQVRLTAQVLACLSSEEKKSAFDGKQVTMTYSAFPRKDLLRGICEYAAGNPGFGQMCFGMNRTEPLTMTDEEVKNSLLIVKVDHRTRPDAGAGFNFMIYGIPVEMAMQDDEKRRLPDTWSVNPIELADALIDNKVPGIPSKPDVQSKLHPEDEFPMPGFSALSSDVDWDTPALQRKLSLGLTRTNTGPTSAEILVELARKSGLNVVSEDFTSHRDLFRARPRVELGKEVTVADVLRNAESRMLGNHRWFVDSDSKLLCGWVNEWRRRHTALVPQSTLSRIREKRKTTGAELDDLMPLIGSTLDQRFDWIEGTQDYLFFEQPHSTGRALWLLYAGLGDEDKALAKGTAGLPLAKLDAQLLSMFLLKAMEESEVGIIHMSPPEEIARHPHWLRTICSPDRLARLSLRAVPVPVERWRALAVEEDGFVTQRECVPASASVTKHTYRLEVFGELDGKDFSNSVRWDNPPFPYFTIEREAQLAAKETPYETEE